jgi:two-component system, sensor histidine kinase and response regulator
MTLNSYKVLIADDNPTFAKTLALLIKTILGSKLTRLDFALNGKEAVDLAFANGNYDIVFMDVTMPEMDGITATRIINQEFCRETRIIAVSFIRDMNTVIKMLESGAVNYIYKDKLTVESIERVFHVGLSQIQ